ncbi:DUF1178 family protein [Polymorphobacter fuscus]|uniref:DUF1178 family protein n=1 Tax=Sandarakinorhabdus fusca TaxID=1439888 RepID=A0A7C9LFG3_9SPHN|nr:DUF1178 family protein [Polymorphobacter fuscus]KAB7647436.1 DUF1178 family protein [Polymorphobacter fuscus]MQT16687.1 DUF1178 family protein [Polymorphobacter fuscus]NJC09327.1 hypothetical protein [Polymorphobacter fuscus]
MIVFDLGCGSGHVFEAWFGSSDAYESQRARGLIACPLCGNADIAKAVMAPAVAAKGNRAPAPMAQLLQAQRAMEAEADYVGRDFAARARALHDDPAPARGIYGEATAAEAAALHEDGIAVLPLPFRPLARSDA